MFKPTVDSCYYDTAGIREMYEYNYPDYRYNPDKYILFDCSTVILVITILLG
jgi:hypothetical protein